MGKKNFTKLERSTIRTILFFSSLFRLPPGIFSLCQDGLSSDASELGAALLSSSRAGSVYVAVSRKSIVHRDLGRTIEVCRLRCSRILLSIIIMC